MNTKQPYQVIQPVRPYQYVSQVHMIHPVRLIATPPMTPFETDARSVVDNFSETSYENYRNNYVFNQMPQHHDYSTFGLRQGGRPEQAPQEPVSAQAQVQAQVQAQTKKPRRQSKYSEAVVNGTPVEPKKDDSVVVITVPVEEPVKKKNEEPVKKEEPPKKKEQGEKIIIEGNFKPAPPMKLTGDQFVILEENTLRAKEGLSNDAVFAEAKQQKPLLQQQKKYVPPIQKKELERIPEETSACLENGAGTGANTGAGANASTSTSANAIPIKALEEKLVAQAQAQVPVPVQTPDPILMKTPCYPAIYSEVKGNEQPILYNTVSEKRTEKHKFVIGEYVITIDNKMYYIPSQVVALDVATYIHCADAAADCAPK